MRRLAPPARHVLAWLLLAALAGCAPGAGGGQCGLTPAGELFLTVRGQVPLLDVGINGKTARMGLDTGSAGTLLTEAAVARLGLRHDMRAPMRMTGIGGETEAFPAVATGLRLGDLALPDRRVAVQSNPLPESAGEQPDGLLGMDVLKGFDMDLDLPASRLRLYRGRPCPDLPLPMPGPAIVVETMLTAKGHLVMRAGLDGRPVAAILDTGAARSVVAREVAGLSDAALAADPVMSLSGVGPGKAQARLHRFALVTQGGENFAERSLLVVDTPPAGYDMVVGMDYLRGRRMWISLSTGRIYVQKPPPH